MIPQFGTLRLSRSRLRHNLAAIRSRLASHTKICATIKANAYGHGSVEMSRMLHEAGVEWICVYSLEEALDLAALPWFGVLVLAPLVMTSAHAMPREMLKRLCGAVRVNVTDIESARCLSRALVGAGVEPPLKVHVQVDTGLTRAGVDPADVAALAGAIGELPGLYLEGLFAHFSHGDVPGHETMEGEAKALQEVARPLKEKHPHLLLHVQNSGGVWHLSDERLDLVRAGIAMYGLQPSTADRIAGLLPVAEVTAPILAIHERETGVGVGYGHTFVTARRSRLAIVPVGYADGYPRMLSNSGVAQVGGADVPLVGRVSMDQIILDVTDIPSARPGDVVTVISGDPARRNSLDQMADAVGTIGYELATHLGGRLRRVVVD